MSVLDTLGSFPGYCEEGALVAGLFDSFRARASRELHFHQLPTAARTNGRHNGEQPRERIGPPEGTRQRGVQFEMHWRKNGEARRKTPRVEPTMKGQEGSGTLPKCILPATTTNDDDDDGQCIHGVLASDMPISEM